MGILESEIMRTYDTRPSTAQSMMVILEAIDRIAKAEYARGRDDVLKSSGIPAGDDIVSRRAAIEAIRKCKIKEVREMGDSLLIEKAEAMTEIMMLMPVEPKIGD